MTVALSKLPLSSTSICLRINCSLAENSWMESMGHPNPSTRLNQVAEVWEDYDTHLNLLMRSKISSCLKSGYFFPSLMACIVVSWRMWAVD